MRTLLTGGTGFIGSALARELRHPVVLSRDPDAARRRLGPDAEAVAWAPEEGPPPATAFDGVDVVYHLAGESVGEGRWDAEKKARILSSRLLGTRNLTRAMQRLERRPRVLVSASAIGIYGDRVDELLDERAAAGDGFLAGVCRDWEAEAMRATELGVRVVLMRIGVVLGRGGGALGSMLFPFRLGLGGRLGHGRQWMSWIYLGDLVSLLQYVAAQDTVAGPVNAVAPQPATNSVFTATLAAHLRRPALLPVPATALRLVLGEFASVLVSSQRVVPRAAQAAGYQFIEPELKGALAAALGDRSRRESTRSGGASAGYHSREDANLV